MLYVCKECGQTSPKKMGKCFRCGKWDAFVLENNDKNSETEKPDKECHCCGKKFIILFGC